MKLIQDSVFVVYSTVSDIVLSEGNNINEFKSFQFGPSQ